MFKVCLLVIGSVFTGACTTQAKTSEVAASQNSARQVANDGSPAQPWTQVACDMEKIAKIYGAPLSTPAKNHRCFDPRSLYLIFGDILTSVDRGSTHWVYGLGEKDTRVFSILPMSGYTADHFVVADEGDQIYMAVHFSSPTDPVGNAKWVLYRTNYKKLIGKVKDFEKMYQAATMVK